MASKKKKPLKKPPKKPTPKKKRQPRSLEPTPPKKQKAVEKNKEKAVEKSKKGTFLARVNEIRRLAAVDYITDPQARSLDHWYGRRDRPYQRMISFKRFEEWASEDSWKTRRDEFWDEITDRVIAERKQQAVLATLKETEELTEVRTYMGEYLAPQRDKNGEVMRYPPQDEDGRPHPLAGLPRFGLDLPKYDRFAKMFIELDKHLMLKRGEATSRTDSMEPGEEGAVRRDSLDPVSQKVSVSREDAREMAKVMLMRRQPELEDAIDVPLQDEEDSEGEDDGGQE